MNNKMNKTLILVEGAIMIALATVLSYLKVYELPQGGSITLEMIPLVVMGIRHGNKWGCFTGFVHGILQMALELTEASRMEISGFINNTNLLGETTIEEVLEGERIIKEASEKCGIPFVATTVMEDAFTEEELSKLSAPEIIKLSKTIHYNY